jgi:hypothetical protein
LRERAGVPYPGIERHQHLPVYRAVADDHGRAAVVAPADVGQGAYRPVAYGGRWLGARRVIDRAPLSDDFSPVAPVHCP